MTDNELMSIGEFAKLTGMTASALRFYDDTGLLRPADVDALTGYRRYGESQLSLAYRLRLLRAIGMPLLSISRFFAADEDDAVRMIDDQLGAVDVDAAEARQAASELKVTLGNDDHQPLGTISGVVLAGALDQVLATTIDDLSTPILSGIRVEVASDAVTLIATDRYRLAIRTLVHQPAGPTTWSGTVDGDDLRRLHSQLRRSPTVKLTAGTITLGIQFIDGTVADLPLRTEVFPDYREMISVLSPVTLHLTIEKKSLLNILEKQAPEFVGIRVAGQQPSLLIPGMTPIELAGSASGPDLTLCFELITLYPALSHALGGDLMFNIRGTDQPVTLRSADDGDLTTVLMPCPRPALATEGTES